jgi:hypothetical protein
MKRVTKALACVLLASAGLAQQQSGPLLRRQRLEGIEVTLSLAKRDAIRKPVPWPPGDFSLAVENTAAGKTTIQELLLARHVQPDVEAFSLVYALNPYVTDLEKLIEASEIRLPRIVAVDPLRAMLDGDTIVLVTVDMEAKDAFAQNVKTLIAATDELRQKGDAAFANAEIRKAIEPVIDLTADRLGKIATRVRQRSGRPLPADILGYLGSEAELLRQTITDATASKTPIGKKQQELIGEISEDVEVAATTFSVTAAGEAPDRWPKARVTAHTLKDSKEAGGYRIYFVPKPLLKNEARFQSFNGLSSPAAGFVGEGQFCFWGAQDPWKKPLTNIHCTKIRIGQTDPIHLTVLTNGGSR